METRFKIQYYVWMDGTGRITIPELIREEMMISGKTKFIIIQESKDRLILERVKE